MSAKQPRRKFLWLSTSTAALAISQACGGKQTKVEGTAQPPPGPNPHAGPQAASDLVMQSTPSEYFTTRDAGSREMNWGPVKHLGDTIPSDRFYIHNRARPPEIDRHRYRLEISGDAVARPRSFSFDDLLAFHQVTLRRTLDCGANCRAFFRRCRLATAIPSGCPSASRSGTSARSELRTGPECG